MLFGWLGALGLGALSILLCTGQTHAQNSNQWPVHDDGLNDVVQWDHYSFKIHGKRLFVFSGELHYWRIPVPEIWEDLLEKIKAAGFTAFAFYSHWGYHSPNPSTIDMTSGAHDFSPLLTIAKKVGLYVIVRPGPYVNAEANAGGFPGWLTTGAYGSLRNNDTAYTNAWRPFFSEYSKIVSEHLVTNGGNAFVYQIENEYGEQWSGTPTERVPNPSATAYMELLKQTARENGIDIPLIVNAPNMNGKSWSKDFSNAGGNVDVYGLDSYPSCWSCNLDECTGTNGQYIAYKVVDYHEHFQEVSPTQPEFMPEFQGGSYNPWGGPEGGCPNDIGADFANLFYRDNIAQRITAMSLYMMYGGTSWGSLAAPVVATSYDYSSPISENRALWSKYYETKNLALFTRVARDLTVTDRLGNSTSYTTNPVIMATKLRNPETGGAFYVTRHANSSSSTYESFKLHISTSIGNFTVPQHGGAIVLNGHQSKILVTDFAFGSHSLIYSTAEVLTYAVTDGSPILALWVPTGESGEFYVKGGKRAFQARCQGCSNSAFSKTKDGVIVSFTQGSGMSVVTIDDDIQILILDRSYAYTLWAPVLTPDPFAPVEDTILVHGPYLVRAANLSKDKHTLEITGDISNETTIKIFAPPSVEKVSWNGKNIKTSRTTYDSLIGKLTGTNANEINLPAFSSWRSQDSLPERFPSYDDHGPAWVSANHTDTPNPSKPKTLPVLYLDDYGFNNGAHLWRGYFSGSANGVSLSVQGGQAFGWSAWLNGVFIGSYLGGPYNSTGDLTLSFENVTLYTNQSNVLLVLQDNNGHDLRSGAVTPRGILSAILQGNNFTSWRLAGAAGGNANLLDPVRGIYNEGGLSAERQGWHLPGFDDSAWQNATSSSIGFSGAGVRFYRTVVPLDIPSEVDVSLSILLSSPKSKKLRAQLFVNGYQFGRFNPWIGSQIDFPVPPGILDYAGDNTIGISVWAQSEESVEVGVEWKLNYVLDSSFNVRFKSDYLRPKWSPERLQYV